MVTRRLTLVFTDIEGSTKLLERLGDAYPALLASHRELVRSAARATGGEEVDCRGDGFFLAFEHPDAAARFAVRAQRVHLRATWPDGEDVRLRVGIHTGEALVGSDGYVGLEYNPTTERTEDSFAWIPEALRSGDVSVRDLEL